MGALWWWIWELSAREIVETLSEVEVVGDPAVVNSVQTSDLMEIVLDASDLGPLESLRAQRERQRHQPGFGQLVGRTRVYLRREFTEDGENETTRSGRPSRPLQMTSKQLGKRPFGRRDRADLARVVSDQLDYNVDVRADSSWRRRE
jgi:hypothetical protein